MPAPFHGAFTALITPFRDGTVDEAAFKVLIERQIAAGINGLVPVGTTGEPSTMTVEEHQRTIALCVETVRGRTPVFAGCGANDTKEAAALMAFAKSVGADAALVVTPYYNRPSQDGLVAHYMALAEAVQIPMILYNVPGRTGVDLLPETVARIAQHPNVIGIKEASGKVERATQLRRLCGQDFLLLSGDDATALGFCAMGGDGATSVTSNVAPELCARLFTCCAAGDFGSAHEIDRRLFPLHAALFVEPSPAPAKYALSRLGLCSEDVRLPLLPVSAVGRAAVDAAMKEAGLL